MSEFLKAAVTHGDVTQTDASALIDRLEAGEETVQQILDTVCPGCNVVLHGLVKRPDLNGRVGRVMERSQGEPRRFPVRVDGESRVLSLKPDNFSICASASKAPSSADPADERTEATTARAPAASHPATSSDPEPTLAFANELRAAKHALKRYILHYNANPEARNNLGVRPSAEYEGAADVDAAVKATRAEAKAALNALIRLWHGLDSSMPAARLSERLQEMKKLHQERDARTCMHACMHIHACIHACIHAGDERERHTSTARSLTLTSHLTLTLTPTLCRKVTSTARTRRWAAQTRRRAGYGCLTVRRRVACGCMCRASSWRPIPAGCGWFHCPAARQNWRRP